MRRDDADVGVHRSPDVQGDGGTDAPATSDRPSGIGRALLHGSSWSLLSQLTPVAVNLVLTPYLIHGLGVTQYGLYALAATITIFLSSFDGGIGSTTPRFFAVYAGKNDRESSTRLLCSLATVIVAVGGLLSVADWFVSPLLADLFDMPARYRSESVFLLRTFGVLVTVSLLHSLFVSLLQARQRFGITSKATVVSYGAWAVGLYFTVRGHYGLRGIALSLIAEQVLATSIILPPALRYLQRRSIGFAPRRELRRFFGFAGKVQMMGVAAFLNMEFDALIIGVFLPVRYVGLYNAGANVSTQVRYTVTSVLPPLANHLATTFGRDGEEAAQREMVQLQRLWVLAISGLTAAAAGAAYFAVLAWLGPQFSISALVCLILLVGNSVNLLTGVMTSYVGAVGRPSLELRYGIVAISVNLLLTVPLVLLGVLGVVSATAAGAVIGSVYFLRVVHRRMSADVPGFFGDVPVVRCGLCAASTVGLELAIAPIVPGGPLGLLLCGVPALVSVTGYVVSLVGLRRSLVLLRAVRSGQMSVDLLAASDPAGGR